MAGLADVFGAEVDRLIAALERFVASFSGGKGSTPAPGEAKDSKTQPLTDSIGQILGPGVAAFIEGLRQAAEALSGTTSKKKTEDLGDAATKAVPPIQQCATAMEAAAQAVNALVSQLGGVPTALPAGGGGRAGAAAGAGEEAAGLGLGEIGAATGGFVLAAQAAVGVLQGLVSSMERFVQALAPGVIEQFNRAIRDLQATVGTAFLPVFQVFIGVIRQAAGIILPLMQELKPIFTELAQIAGANLTVQLRTLVGIVEALMPVFRVLVTLLEVVNAALRPLWVVVGVLADFLGLAFSLLEAALTPVLLVLQVFAALMDDVGEVFHVVEVVIRTLIQTIVQFIASLFGGLSVKGIIDALTAATKRVIESFLLLVAWVARVFGQETFLANLINNLKEQPGEAAAQNPAIKSFEQIGKDMATAAAIATGTGEGGEKKFDLGDVVKELEAIQKGQNPPELLQTLQDIRKFLEYFNQAMHKTATFVRNPLVGGALGAALGF